MRAARHISRSAAILLLLAKVTSLTLHNPASRSHLRDRRERLTSHFANSDTGEYGAGRDYDLIEMLLGVVRCMGKWAVTPIEVIETFTRHGFPSFGKWLEGMLDENVYLDARCSRVA